MQNGFFTSPLRAMQSYFEESWKIIGTDSFCERSSNFKDESGFLQRKVYVFGGAMM